jgi:TetR/AcrR family transcriptional regulator, mexJK operon transcriptional repressor
MNSDETTMVEPRRGRGRPRDLEKREAVLDAAAALFSERGIAPTTIEAVAERASVSKMTVYAHFSDKSELLKAVFARNTARMRFSELGDCADAASAMARLIAYGVEFVRFLTRPEIIATGRAMAESAREFPELAAAFHEAGPQANHDRIAAFLRLGVTKRFWSLDDPNLAAEALLSAWLGMDRERQTFLGAPPRDPAETALRVRAVTEMLARGWGLNGTAG